MRKHMLEQQIRTAVEHAAPDQLDSILSSCEKLKNAPAVSQTQPQGQEQGVIHMTEKKKISRKTGLAAIAAVAAVFVLCFGGFYIHLHQTAPAVVDSVIILDINPSLSLEVDSEEKVLSVEALNEDAKEVLGGMELQNTSLEVALNAIIGSMLQKGYLGDMQNSVLVSVENSDAAQGEKLQQKVSQVISAAMQSGSLNAAILMQTVSADDATLSQLAKEYCISMGKAALIQEVITQAPELTFADLAPMSINEIALIVSSKHVTSESITQDGIASDKAYISQADALSKAYAHAGVDAASISKSEAEFDCEDGIMIYEVEFETATKKWEYDIDARTGEILRFESKAKSAQTTGNESGNYIGETAATEAALAHAGVSKNDTYFTNCYMKYKNGSPAYYCVKFAVGNTEYEYEIDLYSGAVLESSAETKHKVEDTNPSSGSSGNASGSNGTSYIGESAALSVALSHAGVTESSLTGKSVELDKHKNKAVYEVEFEVGHTEYEYEIDAASGEIIKFEIEP